MSTGQLYLDYDIMKGYATWTPAALEKMQREVDEACERQKRLRGVVCAQRSKFLKGFKTVKT